MNDQENKQENKQDNNHDGIDRRTVLTASLGLGAGLVSGIASAQGQSMTTASATTGDIWSQEYWAQKGNIKLNLWRKRVGAPRAGEHARKDAVAPECARLVHREGHDEADACAIVDDGSEHAGKHVEVFLDSRRAVCVWPPFLDARCHPCTRERMRRPAQAQALTPSSL